MNFILASTSTLYKQNFLEYLKEPLVELFSDIEEVIFVPFARPSGISHDEYTAKASRFFSSIDKKIRGLHEFEDPIVAIKNANAIFTGGGNTFLLLKTLYENSLIEPLQEKIKGGVPYLGTSAGSNIAGKNIKTTNDMPIVYPPSFDALGILSFNINPHYLDPDPNSTHNGETRETRLLEFLTQNDINVIGLREGSWIRGKGTEIYLRGGKDARVFMRGKDVFEIPTDSDLDFLR